MLAAALAGGLGARSARAGQAGTGPVKVFIMAGQSNMEGHGLMTFGGSRLKNYRQRKFSEQAIAIKQQYVLDNLAKNPTKAERYRHITDKAGKYVVRDDVWVYYKRGRGGVKAGGDRSRRAAWPDVRLGPSPQT